jgi:hypothetical protein
VSSVFVSAAVPIVGLFAISSFFALEDKISCARKFAKAGFVAIVIFMIFIGTVNVSNIVAPDIWRQSPIVRRLFQTLLAAAAVAPAMQKVQNILVLLKKTKRQIISINLIVRITTGLS